MPASYSDINPQEQTRKGWAIASLILGIISIPTLGLLVVGAITGIVLGVVALNKIRKDPARYSGKGIAIAGIVTNVVSLALIVVSAAIMIPRLLHYIKLGRETVAINSLRTIGDNQIRFRERNLRFATLDDLARSSLIDQTYASGNAISGYVYSTSDVSEDSYCVHADRISDASGRRDFVICEDGVIRFIESRIRGTVRRGEGRPLSGPH